MIRHQIAFANPSIYRELNFNPKIGDILSRPTEHLESLNHYAMVYEIDWYGRVWVIECTKDIGVRIIPFEDFNIKPNFKLTAIEDHERQEIYQRMIWANSNRELFCWNLLFNCEDFVNWLRLGKPISNQRNNFLLISALFCMGVMGLKKMRML